MFNMFFLIRSWGYTLTYSKTLNNRTTTPNNEYRGGPGGPGNGFGGPRGRLLDNRRSGLPLRRLLRKPPLGPPKPLPGPPGPPRYSLLAPLVRLLTVLE